MDPVQNPYSPGAGRRPPELAGREPELHRFDVLRQRIEEGRSDRGLILTGLRGVGKTVLLNEFRARAEQPGWIVAKVEAGGTRPFRALVAQSLNQALRSATGRFGMGERLGRALAVFKAFTLNVAPDGSLALGIDVEAGRGRADTGDLEVDLTELAVDLGGTARDLGVGTLLLVDEMQDLAAAELAAICAASHEAGQRDVPFLVVGAGLPSLPVALTEAKSYAERLFEYHGVGPLDDVAAMSALVRPGRARGVEWADQAADRILSTAVGYPYFLQVYGRATWDYAEASPIDAEDAAVGIEVGRRELDVGFYGSRWERATAGQKAYLRALAKGGDEPSPTAEVARRMVRRPSDVSVARDQLIKKGLLYAPDRGTIAFTVPGMAEFIARQTA
ncbi:MAG TPA: ATP-binding protein [Acidimicrobiia bacterium]